MGFACQRRTGRVGIAQVCGLSCGKRSGWMGGCVTCAGEIDPPLDHRHHRTSPFNADVEQRASCNDNAAGNRNGEGALAIWRNAKARAASFQRDFPLAGGKGDTHARGGVERELRSVRQRYGPDFAERGFIAPRLRRSDNQDGRPVLEQANCPDAKKDEYPQPNGRHMGAMSHKKWRPSQLSRAANLAVSQQSAILPVTLHLFIGHPMTRIGVDPGGKRTFDLGAGMCLPPRQPVACDIPDSAWNAADFVSHDREGAAQVA